MPPGRFAVTQAQAAAEMPDSPAPSGDSPAPAALSPDLLDLLAPDLRPPAADTPDDGDAETPGAPTATPEAKKPDAGTEPPSDKAAPDAGDQEGTPEPSIEELADQLFDNPQLISRMPRAKLPELVAEYNQRMNVVRDHFYAEGLAAGRAQAMAQAQQQTLAQQAAEIEALIDPNSDTYAPELYAERKASFPGGPKAYARVVAEMTPVPSGSQEDFTERARQLIARELGSLPNRDALVVELQKDWNYPASEEGLTKLAVRIGALKSTGVPAEPAVTELEKRKAAINGLKAAPKADVSEGRSTPLDTDPTPEEVRKMSPEALAELEAKKPGTLVRLAKTAAASAR